MLSANELIVLKGLLNTHEGGWAHTGSHKIQEKEREEPCFLVILKFSMLGISFLDIREREHKISLIVQFFGHFL